MAIREAHIVPCKYCGEGSLRDGEPVCSKCITKYKQVQKFVEVCNDIKRKLGILK